MYRLDNLCVHVDECFLELLNNLFTFDGDLLFKIIHLIFSEILFSD